MPVSPRVQRPLAIKAFPKARRPPCGPPVSPMPRRLAVTIAKTATWPRSPQPPAYARAYNLTPSTRNMHRRFGRRAKSWSANVLAGTDVPSRNIQGEDSVNIDNIQFRYCRAWGGRRTHPAHSSRGDHRLCHGAVFLRLRDRRRLRALDSLDHGGGRSRNVDERSAETVSERCHRNYREGRGRTHRESRRLD